MSGRRKRTSGLIRVICTDPRHWDTDEYARRGFHFVVPMVLLPMQDGGFTMNWRGISPAVKAPVKAIVHADGEQTYHFECSCGRDVQWLEHKLMDHVMAKFRAAVAADPRATRIDLDITTI